MLVKIKVNFYYLLKMCALALRTFICYRYIYKVKYRDVGTPLRCKWPKATITEKIRTQNTVYLDYDDKVIKSITYPKELCYQPVAPDDIVEHMLIHIKEIVPDWVEIEVNRINNKEFL